MKKLFQIILFSVVGILLISGVGVTIFDDVSKNIVSQENNTTERYFIETENMDLTVEFVSGTTYRINGVEIQPILESAVIVDGFAMLFNGQGQYLIRSDSMTTYGGQITPAPGSLLFTVDKGSYEYSYNGETITGETETLLYPSPKGNYGSFTTNPVSFNVSIGDVVYAASYTAPYFEVTRIIDGMDEANVINPCTSNGAYTEGTPEISIVATLSEDGKSYNYSNIEFSNDGEPSGLRMCFAPIFYDVVDANAQAAKDIVGVIPIILILILLVGVAYGLMSYVKSGRNEL